MFRPIRRKNKEISIDEAKALLAGERRGILAVNGDDGYPYAIPINFYYDEQANRIYFHGALVGHKAEAIQKDSKVCFTVYGNESIRDAEWAPYVQSAVAFGRCVRIEDRELVIERVRRLAQKYYPNDALIEEEIEQSGKAVQIYEITIEHLSGKEIQER